VLAGPDATPALLSTSERQSWSVSPSSDRRGVRLVGDALPTLQASGERLTIGVLPGAIQLPPDGQPIVLLADAQPTGGYPVIAVVIEADVPILGQLATGDELRFRVVDVDEARAANEARRRELEAGVQDLRAAEPGGNPDLCCRPCRCRSSSTAIPVMTTPSRSSSRSRARGSRSAA
jgi:allophanate hydrolase subunit 2